MECHHPVFGESWTMYRGAHAWFHCDPEQPGECEEHNCLETHLMEGYTPAAAATAKPLPIPLIVIEPSTLTHSIIVRYLWQ